MIDNLAKFAWVELGKVKVHCISDLNVEKTTDQIELYPDLKYAFNAVFEDRLDQMNWKNHLEVSLHFKRGTVKHTWERGEQTRVDSRNS
jgi:hypothetical protein